MKDPNAPEPETPEPDKPEPDEEGVPAPWPLKLAMTLVPFLLIVALLFLDRCRSD